MNAIELVTVRSGGVLIKMLVGINYNWPSMINGGWAKPVPTGWESFDPMI